MPNISLSRSDRRRSRIHKPPSSPSAQNCKKCSAPDSQGDMVECCKCEKWFHFTCVGVTQEVENEDWFCNTCSLKQRQQVIQDSTLRDNRDNTAAPADIAGATAPAVHSTAPPAIPAADLATALTGALQSTSKRAIPVELHEKSAIQCTRVAYTKSQSINQSSKCNSSKTTSSAKTVKMQLRKLEEERKLQEKRDREYIDKKYAILEQLYSDDEQDSIGMESLDRNRVKEWVDKTTFPDDRRDREDKKAQPDFYDSWLGNSPMNHVLCKNQDETKGEVSINKSQIAARHLMSKDQLNFSGRPEEWPLFISWWKNSSKICGFTNYENMLRLQRCLKGKALESVRFKLLHPDQVDQVIATLTMLFGRPEIIIKSLLDKIRDEPGPKYEKLETMVNFSLEVDNMCRTMEVTGLSAHLNNPSLLQELVDKLPVPIKLNWGVFKQTLNSVDLSVFNDWLAQLAKAASEVTLTVPSSLEPKINKKTKAIINVHQEATPQEDKKCPACKSDCKTIAVCDEFSKMSIEDRWKLIKRFYICRTCLRRHGSRRCLSSQLCGVDNCTYRHNALLHNNAAQLKAKNNGDTNAEQPTSTRSIQNNAFYSGTIVRPSGSAMLFKILPVTLHYNNKFIDTYAFIDDGSSVTLIDEELAVELDARGDFDPLCLRWTANTHRLEESSMRITFEIAAQGTEQKYLLPNTHTVKSLELPRQSIDLCRLTQQYSHLKGIPIKSYKNAKPQILLGLQHCKLGMALKTREGTDNQPAAIKTRLGWTLFGAVSASVASSNLDTNINIHFCDCQNQIDLNIHDTVKQYFTLESLGTKPTKRTLSDEEYKAVQILEEKTIFLGDSYAVPLLWKYENVSLPNTKGMAEKRLHCLEKRLLNQPLLLDKVNNEIEQYVKKGYAKRLNSDEINSSQSRVWYLPIFPVTNPNKPDKLRIVWDAAAKVNGLSLNSFLMTGPDSVPELPSVLFRFRERKFAISGDIREMFHQIKILEVDKDAQRFLWRNTVTGNIDVYQMQVMTFGSTCSPFCAQFIKNKNAKKFAMQYPRASKAIIDNHYVDDFLDSTDTEEEAINLSKEVIFIHKQAGFEIRNFISNSTNVINALPSQASRSSKLFTDNAQNEFEKLLGMWWSPVTDMFTYAFKSNKIHQDVMSGARIPTKREALRALMCIFDPLGLIANFTIHLKIILQEVWRSGVDWDEKIKDRQFEKWKMWLSLIPKVKNISINRRYLTNLRFGDGSCAELHLFVDASEEAIAAVAYIRVSNENAVECALISAKTKVAPIKTLSIPRLELEAAVLGVRLSKFIQSGHTIHFDSLHFWTDSQVVLSWIKSSNKKYKSFVAVRIGEILESSDVKNWNWVPSKENVADDASKYKSTYEFSSSGRWYTGPTFLYQNPLNPPKNNSENFISDEGNEEVKECYTHIKTTYTQIVDCNRFSRWKRLHKTVMYIFRFVKLFVLKWRTKVNPPVFTLDDKEAALNFLYRQCQKESFPTEHAALTNAENSQQVACISKSSALYKLSPYVDENGVIRIQGRIDAIDNVLPETKRPIIMPKDHLITHLIVNECHIKYYHMFNETVVNELRQSFFIPSLRRVLKKVIQKCQHCKNKRAAPQPPRMAELPLARLQPFMRPFSYTGVDYFGPLYVKVGRRLDKRWGMLLTCLTVRAIHIEIVHSLSSDSCILGFKRFISRRGMPKEVYSDNGTNFRGASKELEQAIQDLNKNAVAREFQMELKWNFIPPAAPHMGGSWERMVRSVKQTFAEITPTRNPCDELLLSMMAEVESIVNSRPLTYVPIDCESSEALTPNHLLMGCPNRECLSQEFIDDGRAVRRNWLAAEKYATTFWHRWIREYLPDLTRRTKWFTPHRQLKEGDIVIIVDHDNPRKTWPRGKILKVLPGRDGTVRSAVVQTGGGIYTRPAVKLAVLDIYKSEEDGNVCPQPSYQGGV